MSTSNFDIDLSTYRCFRATALWFAKISPHAYSVNTHSSNWSFKQGENYQWSTYWLEQSLVYWGKLQSALAAEPSLSGMTNGIHLFAPNVDSQHAAECICPDCTAVEIERLKKKAL